MVLFLSVMISLSFKRLLQYFYLFYFSRSVMMPALYQLVPGSMIAKLWFNYIFPPRLEEKQMELGNTGLNYTVVQYDEQANNVFGGLMIISTSLALGLVVGFAVVQIWEDVLGLFSCKRKSQSKLKDDEKLRRAKDRRIGMYSAPVNKDENPASVAEELKKAILHGLSTEAEVDEVFNAIDIDCSGSIDEGEVTFYMLKAGLTVDQINKLFASMDKDGDGEVSRVEFRRAILDRSNAKLLLPPNPDAEVELNPVMYKAPSATEIVDAAPSDDQDEPASLVSIHSGNIGPNGGIEATA